jgi:hypothetical protein
MVEIRVDMWMEFWLPGVNGPGIGTIDFCFGIDDSVITHRDTDCSKFRIQ